MTEAVINNGCLAHNCIYNIMINSIVIFHHLSQCRVRGRNCISFLVGCIHTEAAQHHSQHFPLLFHCSPNYKAVFQYWLRFLGPHRGLSYSVSQFLDGSSNFKAGCKKAFYIIVPFTCHVLMHDSSNFFPPSSGNDMHHCPL